MTDQNTFAEDQGNKGTTGFGDQNTDDKSGGENNSGTDYQQQISGMEKRLNDKDEHIQTIQSENQTLREKMAEIEEKLQAMGSVDDALTRMKEAQNSNQDTALDEDKLVSRVLGKMEQMTVEEKAAANFSEVSSTLTKLYGADKVDETMKSVAKENGLSFDDMIALAKKSPQAIYRMAGVKQTGNPSGPAPSHNTNIGFNDENKSREEKLAYFAKLRRESPKEYWKPEVQKQFREVCLSK